MKKMSVFIFTCFLLSACTARPILKNVPYDAEEKPINTTQQIEKLTKKND